MTELKINEVMVDDWVDVRNEAAPDTSHIERITPAHFFRSEIWYGIELTAEILEKNGFKGEGYAILDIDENSWLEYYYYEHRLRKKWRGVDEWQNHAKVTEITFQCHCSYVHELQRAMKMCNIEKDIKL